MKTKTLALVGGILGIIGGIVLLFGPFFLLGSVLTDMAGSANPENVQATNTIFSTMLFLILKITILVIGIVCIVYYKGTELVKPAPSILLIVGGAVTLIPFLGFVGGIVAIVGGGLFLASLKNFKTE